MTAPRCTQSHDDIVRRVHLPLELFDKCAICELSKDEEGSKIDLCSSCGERLYCSIECQKTDWPTHKQICGQTDYINLETYYPFLAILAERFKFEQPLHFALKSPITNNVNPSTSPIKFQDGWEAKLIIVDDTVPGDNAYRDPETWYPKAESLSVTGRLMARILREGNVLPCLTAIALSILAEVYTTTSGSESQQRRIRLRYRTSPIADFGIAQGSVVVTSQDQLAYIKKSDRSFVRGQDPNEHYWLYFTTIRGEEVLLDLNLFTFNMCTMVALQPYLSSMDYLLGDYAPAFFCDRAMRIGAPSMHNERKRVSVLRNPALHAVASKLPEALHDHDVHIVRSFMEEFAGRPVSETEETLACQFTVKNCSDIVRTVIKEGRWREYPDSVPMSIQGDPGELDTVGDSTPPNLKAFKKSRTVQRH